MADSDDPCDDVTNSPVEWIGWVKTQDKKVPVE